MKVFSVVLNNFKNDSRVLKESKSLAHAGYDVLVLALHESGLDEKEIVEGICVRRVRLKTRGWPKIKLIQFIKYFEFLCRAMVHCRNADIVHCNDLDALPVGMLVRMFFNKKINIVYDAHEFEINDVPNQSTLSIWLKFYLERFLVKHVSAVITVSESIADEYVRLYGIERPNVVLNCPPMQNVEKKDLFRELFGIRKDQVVFLYQGGLSPGRGIELLLSSFSDMKADDNVIVFMGYGSLEALVKISANSYKNIYYLPAVSPAVLLDYTASADYGVFFCENKCLSHYYCAPNKLFEYLMVELPVVVADSVEMKAIVDRYQIGIVAKKCDSSGVSESVVEIRLMDYKKMVRNIRSVKSLYNWEVQEKELLRVYGALSS